MPDMIFAVVGDDEEDTSQGERPSRRLTRQGFKAGESATKENKGVRHFAYQ